MSQYPPHQPYQPQPPAPLSPQEERTWATMSHVIALVATVISGGTFGFVGPLVVYLIYKDRSPWVRRNSANSLNVQLMTLIGVIISFVLMFVLIGFVTYPLVILYAVVVHIIGAVKANNGEPFNPPMTIGFVR